MVTRGSCLRMFVRILIIYVLRKGFPVCTQSQTWTNLKTFTNRQTGLIRKLSDVARSTQGSRRQRLMFVSICQQRTDESPVQRVNVSSKEVLTGNLRTPTSQVNKISLILLLVDLITILQLQYSKEEDLTVMKPSRGFLLSCIL